MRILISLALALPSGIEAGADSVFRSKLCELGGGGVKLAGRVTLRGGSAAAGWCRDFEDLAPGFPIAAQPPAEAAHQDDVEALFRHAFFLTHYRLNFVQARQLLDRVLVLNPQHVPALTTLGQLLYLAYNDYDTAEGLLLRALGIDRGHLLARMHLDLVRSLRRAATLVPYLPYQPLPPIAQYTHTDAAAMEAVWHKPSPAGVWAPEASKMALPWAVTPREGESLSMRPAQSQGAGEGQQRKGGGGAVEAQEVEQTSPMPRVHARDARDACEQPSMLHSSPRSQNAESGWPVSREPARGTPSLSAREAPRAVPSPSHSSHRAAARAANPPPPPLQQQGARALPPPTHHTSPFTPTPQPPLADSTANAAASEESGSRAQPRVAEEQPEEPDDLPEGAGHTLEERLKHSGWKVRAFAYQEVACGIFALATGAPRPSAAAHLASDAQHMQWPDYASVLTVALNETNVVTLDKGLTATLYFLHHAPLPLCQQLSSSSAEGLVKKGLVSARNAGKAEEVLREMIAAEGAAHVMPHLLAGMSSNNAKLALAATRAVEEAVREFGGGVTQARQGVVRACVALFNSSAAAVRAAALSLARQLLLTLGPSIRPLFDSLRDIQRKEIDDMMRAIPPTAGDTKHHPPLRATRAQALAVLHARSSAGARDLIAHAMSQGDANHNAHMGQLAPPTATQNFEADPEDDEEGERMYLESEAHDVLGKLGRDWQSKVLGSAKWQDKTQLLQLLVSLSSHPRLVAADYSEVVKSLRVLLSDSMVLVVVAAIKAIGQLGAGLRGDFNIPARGLMIVLIDKLKDKNRAVIEAVHATLDIFLLRKCTTVMEINEYLVTALGRTSTPKVRIEVLKFITRNLGHRKMWLNSVPRRGLDSYLSLSDAVLGCVDDGSLDVRQAAMGATEKMMEVMGTSHVLSRIQQVVVDSKRRNKLLEIANEIARINPNDKSYKQ